MNYKPQVKNELLNQLTSFVFSPKLELHVSDYMPLKTQFTIQEQIDILHRLTDKYENLACIIFIPNHIDKNLDFVLLIQVI